MTLRERLLQLASALPSDRSAITITRADLESLLEGETGETAITAAQDLTVEEVAEEMRRAPSTVRGWLNSKALRGYKLNNRDWRIPRTALRDYLDAQATQEDEPARRVGKVDITAWRKVRGS